MPQSQFDYGGSGYEKFCGYLSGGSTEAAIAAEAVQGINASLMHSFNSAKDRPGRFRARAICAAHCRRQSRGSSHGFLSAKRLDAGQAAVITVSNRLESREFWRIHESSGRSASNRKNVTQANSAFKYLSNGKANLSDISDTSGRQWTTSQLCRPARSAFARFNPCLLAARFAGVQLSALYDSCTPRVFKYTE